MMEQRASPAHIIMANIYFWEKKEIWWYGHTFKIPIDREGSETGSDLNYFINSKLRCLIRAYIYGDSLTHERCPPRFLFS